MAWDIPHLNFLKRTKSRRDDVFLVRLAVESRANLVTTDRPLHNDLANCGIQARYNLTVLSTEDALASL